MGIFDKLKKKSPKEKKQTRIEKHVKLEASPTYSLYKDIKTSPLAMRTDTDKSARNYITENCNMAARNRIVPGQMLVFEYFQPKTQDELEYYDASPCTIFFGVFNSSQGKRVLGFNIHYYPPKIRRRVLDRIFEIYRPFYTKYFTEGPKKEIDSFDYQNLVASLQKAKLDFGVRMYDPDLIGKAWMIAPNQWSVAVFTEGWFKKRTRQAIIKYWNNYKSKLQS